MLMHESRNDRDISRDGVLAGRLTPRATLDSGPEAGALVARAVARAKAGDQDALRFLYVRFADNVYGYVRSIVKDEHEAEDVTQNVFAKLMRIIHKYEDRGLPFHAWILRVARNVALDHLRQRRGIPCEEVRGEETDAGEVGHARCRALESALATLPEDQRQVLALRHIVGLSPEEIAVRLNRSESSVHGLHHRGRLALREALLEMGAGPTVRAAPNLAVLGSESAARMTEADEPAEELLALAV
jgi:RNA polymerase sigma-70 factor (ECF subfamily)